MENTFFSSLIFAILLGDTHGSIECDYRIVPGYNFVGTTFDAATIQAKTLPVYLFNYSCENAPDCGTTAAYGPCLWTNPLDQMQQFFVPDNFSFGLIEESTFLNGSQIFRTINDFTHYFASKEEDDDDDILFSSSSSRYVSDFQFSYYENDQAMTYAWNSWLWFQLSMWQFPPPPFHPQFLRAINSLPIPYDANNPQVSQVYQNFFYVFGTHAVTEAQLGATQHLFNWFHRCFLFAYSDDWVTTTTEDDYLVATDASGQSTHSSQLNQNWVQDSETIIIFVGGNSYSYEPSQTAEWLTTTSNNPVPVSYSLSPIYSLIEDAALAASLKQATSDYMTAAAVSSIQQQSQLVPKDPYTMPPWCPGYL